MTSPRSPSGSPQSRPPGRPKRPRRLKPDIAGAHPFAVFRVLADDCHAGGQMDCMPDEALAQVLAAIDDFNGVVRLPAIYPQLNLEMQREINRQRALQTSRDHPRR